ncbi:lysine N(6)-hydroxylase/L-ornithine N(5)-oxygenase family protein [Streptomyces sp. WMMC905]|uniref:lysine N(6)-hydroxylase/L-ornithine N(5)-oxygenase family protein n=1 Tax=Streptomyces sp. WMMC905 TaxID=3404123 RepID=UPI003B93F56A
MRRSPVRRPAPLRDLVGVGVGPANLSLAALAQPLDGLDAVFLDQSGSFRWHPGLLVEGARLQVPFLADLVTLADPASGWSFLNYLREHERLFPFYLAERFHVRRAEYDAYCRWVAERLPSLRFGHRVDTVGFDPERAVFDVRYTRTEPVDGVESRGRVSTRAVVVGVGTEPHVPQELRSLWAAPGAPVLHAADYLEHRETLVEAGHVTVVGIGQSGAEIFLDLLRRRPVGSERLHWLGRTEALAPMEYSRLGLEHFTPDYTRYFHGLAEPVRDRLVASQWQLHRGIDDETLTAIHDELYRRALGGGWPDTVITPGVSVRGARRPSPAAIELRLDHAQQNTTGTLATDAVVLATGYRERPLDGVLGDIADRLGRDARGRFRVDERFRLVLDPTIAESGCRVYVQNAERHTHGVGAPDLGLVAWRSASILNDLIGEERYPLPRRSAFTRFGLAGGVMAGP